MSAGEAKYCTAAAIFVVAVARLGLMQAAAG